MSYQKVLINLSAGDFPESLVEKMKMLSATTDTQFELFCSCYNSPLHLSNILDKEAEKHAIASYMQERESYLIAIADRLEGEGLTVSYDVCWNSNQSEGVIRRALRYQADLILSVMGKHDLGHYLLRQGDWQLISDSPVPVMLVRQQSWPAHPRVIAAVDPFHDCEEPDLIDQVVLDNASILGQQTEAELHIAHTYSAIPHSAIFDEHLTADYEALKAKVKSDHETAMKDFIQRFGLEDVLFHLEEGEVHSALSSICNRESASVLVMGSISRSFFERLLLGSSVERVIDKVESDILLVKQPGFVSPIAE